MRTKMNFHHVCFTHTHTHTLGSSGTPRNTVTAIDLHVPHIKGNNSDKPRTRLTSFYHTHVNTLLGEYFKYLI